MAKVRIQSSFELLLAAEGTSWKIAGYAEVGFAHILGVHKKEISTGLLRHILLELFEGWSGKVEPQELVGTIAKRCVFIDGDEETQNRYRLLYVYAVTEILRQCRITKSLRQKETGVEGQCRLFPEQEKARKISFV